MSQPGLPGKEFACHLGAIICHLARELDQAIGGISAPKTTRKNLKLPGSRGERIAVRWLGCPSSRFY